LNFNYIVSTTNTTMPTNYVNGLDHKNQIIRMHRSRECLSTVMWFVDLLSYLSLFCFGQ